MDNLDGEGLDFKDVPMLASSYGQFEMRVSNKSLNFGVKEKYTMDAVLESNTIQKEIRSRSIYVPHSVCDSSKLLLALRNWWSNIQ